MKGFGSVVAVAAAGLLAISGNAEPIPRSSKCKLPLVKDVSFDRITQDWR